MNWHDLLKQGNLRSAAIAVLDESFSGKTPIGDRRVGLRINLIRNPAYDTQLVSFLDSQLLQSVTCQTNNKNRKESVKGRKFVSIVTIM